MRISDWSSDVCSSDLASLTIRDRGGEGNGAVLYADAAGPGRSGHDSADVFSRSLPLDVYGRSWELDFSADMQAALAHRAPDLRMTLVAGIIASIGRASWRERVCRSG